MPMNLVTGGSGFIGRHLVNALVSNGERVRILDLAPADDLPAEAVRGSVLDENAIDAALADVDCVYHLAGIAKLWTKTKSDYALINARGTEMLLQAAARRQIARVVHCSTEAILLPKRSGRSESIDEDVQPVFDDMPGPYTRSKLLAEQAVGSAARAGLNAVIVNPTVPIGAGDHNLTPPAAMLLMFLRGQSPAFLDCVLNVVDVRDVANGMMLAAERGRPGERYILGGENMSLRELLLLLERMSGRPMPKRAIPGWVALASATVTEFIADRLTGRTPAATREGVRLALRSAPFDNRKARGELGYAPRPLQEALADAVAWLATLDDKSP